MFRCQRCDSRCATCSGPQLGQCKSCDSTNQYPYLQLHSCVASCSPGFYLSIERSHCLPCHEGCLTCTSSNDSSCSECKIGYVLLPDLHRCEKHLGKPYYLDQQTGEVHTCHASCLQCKGPQPNDCLACNITREVLLADGHCVQKCPIGTYSSEKKTVELETNVCLPCVSGCQACQSAERCERCITSVGYQLISGVCVSICSPG
jgi:proprotein convertase subtilisin/kexin type 5